MNENIPLTPEQARTITQLVGMVQATHPLEVLTEEGTAAAIATVDAVEFDRGEVGAVEYRPNRFDVRIHVSEEVDGRGFIDHTEVNYASMVDGGGFQVENMTTGDAHFYAPGSWQHAHRIKSEVEGA